MSTIFLFSEELNSDEFKSDSDLFVPMAAKKWLEILEKVNSNDNNNKKIIDFYLNFW